MKMRNLNHAILRKNEFSEFIFLRSIFQLCLCDCPGLVMPAFAFGRDEMLLNGGSNISQRLLTNQIFANSGILPVDHMRDHFGPIGLLMTRMPLNVLEDAYAMMLPKEGKPSPLSLLTW